MTGATSQDVVTIASMAEIAEFAEEDGRFNTSPTDFLCDISVASNGDAVFVHGGKNGYANVVVREVGDHGRVHVWDTSREVGLENTVQDSSEQFVPAVIPAFRGVPGGGFDVCCVAREAKFFLTYEGNVAFYPQARVSDKDFETIGALNAIRRERGQEGKRHAVHHLRVKIDADDLTNWTPEDAVAPVYMFGGKAYAHVIGIGDDPDTWHLCEPIEVRGSENGNYIAARPLINAPMCEPGLEFVTYQVQSGLKDGDEMDTDGLLIGKYLNEGFLEDVKSLANIMRVKKDEFVAMRTDARIAEKLARFNIGDRVKIKCEGRAGVVVALDRNIEVATLKVDNKSLKYRFDDLVELGN